MERAYVDATTFQVDSLKVEVYQDRNRLGNAVAKAVVREMKAKLSIQESLSIVFASAPSQDDFLASLSSQPGLEWNRVAAFHMDEYVGLSSNSPHSFSWYLWRHLFNKINPGHFYVLDGMNQNIEEECARYSQLLRDHPLDITCAGIGENGHLAFNDPPVANFKDEALVKSVELTLASRQQQVNDGCFASIDQVPERAISLTIPALISAPFIICIAPTSSKAIAVKEMLSGPISTRCPASILRTHPNATLYLTGDSASMIQLSSFITNK
ncbi:MAG: glucosamine-6-phosphate deaminase [Anaerolineales bacterium]|nr:glucosamine-6-phosphate deaminase [Anaerolineales bacterium]